MRVLWGLLLVGMCFLTPMKSAAQESPESVQFCTLYVLNVSEYPIEVFYLVEGYHDEMLRWGVLEPDYHADISGPCTEGKLHVFIASTDPNRPEWWFDGMLFQGQNHMFAVVKTAPRPGMKTEEDILSDSTGRYCVTDLVTGKKVVVEPIAERDQGANDKTWEVGGAQAVRGGAVRREDSIITEENGFTNIHEVNGSGV